ncbi:DUF1801 domain-containing protein [Microterricola viridarii]|uniref:YdhG-like domain-containing protein n=1 Tax=Microterricola viridarii TaxID=412690 RepID=A0A1H1XFV1_9MICO|nr:DUF1801 domain-containing protein [Microterricola viridarii]SDT08108.1 protein of unknown function (DU1801) [Microterricola viridarii]
MTRAEVDRYLSELDHPQAGTLAELCAIVRAADPRVQETIKWNAPSFFIAEHFATTGLSPRGQLRLVLHTGAKKLSEPLVVTVAGADGLLEWKGTDRAVVIVRDAEQLEGIREALGGVLRQWIAQTQPAP